jgi:hypothetical protein
MILMSPLTGQKEGCFGSRGQTRFGQEKTSWSVKRERERERETNSQAAGSPATSLTGLSFSSSASPSTLFFSSFCPPEVENPHDVKDDYARTRPIPVD